MSRCDLFLHRGVEGRILFRQDNAEAGDALMGLFVLCFDVEPNAPFDRIDIAFIICFLVHREADIYRVKRYPKRIATKSLASWQESSPRTESGLRDYWEAGVHEIVRSHCDIALAINEQSDQLQTLKQILAARTH